MVLEGSADMAAAAVAVEQALQVALVVEAVMVFVSSRSCSDG